jgi:hypothetical protein
MLTFEGLEPTINALILLSNIIRHDLSEGDITRLAIDVQFMNTRYQMHQIVRLIEFASIELNVILSNMEMACAFKTDYSAVHRALQRGYENPPGRGQH